MQNLPLAERCLLCGHRPPRFLCFAISGSLCNLAQLGLDRLLLSLFIEHERQHARPRLPRATTWSPMHGAPPPPDAPPPAWAATACWTVSYTLSVTLRHASHAFFVFGAPRHGANHPHSKIPPPLLLTSSAQGMDMPNTHVMPRSDFVVEMAQRAPGARSAPRTSHTSPQSSPRPSSTSPSSLVGRCAIYHNIAMHPTYQPMLPD